MNKDNNNNKRDTAEQITVSHPQGRFPTDGRQGAYKSYVSASLNTRQTPEQFGGVSTD